MLKKYANIDNNIEYELKNFFPGPFTAILNKSDSKLSNLVTAGLSTIAIRIPDFDPILKVINKINKPIITTSVNRHGNLPLSDISQIELEFKKHYIFYDKKKLISKGSTIIDFSVIPERIIRNGVGKYTQ